MTQPLPELAKLILVRLDWAILVYFLLVNGLYGVLLVAASREIREYLLRVRGESRWRVLGSRVAPSISVIAPAYNESATIAESVGALLALHYANLEIVVVNDGSPDGTLEVLRTTFDLIPIHTLVWQRLDTQPVRALFRSRSHPNLVVADKQNGGKADALNVGLNPATADLVCAIDADTLVEPDALQRMVRPFLGGDDVVAAGGTIRIVNGSGVQHGQVVGARAPRQPLPGVQVIEYLRAFLFGRLGWNRLGGNLIISGAFGLFRREEMIAAGGYAHDTVGEDMEMVLKLRRRAYEQGRPGRVEFVPDPVAWTEAPETFRVLGRQRERWHRGLADVLWRHRRLMLNPRYGALGLVVYPYFVLVELLGPVVELIGWIGLVAGLALGAIDVPFALLFFAVAYGLGLVLSAWTLAMEELSFHRYHRLSDRVILLGWAVAESIGYRQITVLWRLRGLWRFLRGRTDWGRMERRGFRPAPAICTVYPDRSTSKDGIGIELANAADPCG